MRRSVFAIVAALLLLGLGGGAFWWWSRREVPLSPELATPKLVLEALREVAEGTPPVHSLFFTPAAIPFLKELPAAFVREKPEERAAAFASAAHHPGAWRALDRQYRFDVLWLMGDPAEYRPLLDHLRKSPDWVLTYLDPTSCLYRRRPATAWKAGALEEMKARFEPLPVRDRVLARVHLAQRLAALDEAEAARALLDEAIALDGDSCPAWTQLACHYGAVGRWDEALRASTRALEEDPDYPPALAAQANAFYAFGKFNEALRLTRRLVVATPEAGSALYLHARVTHAARAYTEEIEVLERIIAIAEANRLPAGSWYVYLGQAYAATGGGEAAVKAFRKALEDATLTRSEREFALKGLEWIDGPAGGAG